MVNKNELRMNTFAKKKTLTGHIINRWSCFRDAFWQRVIFLKFEIFRLYQFYRSIVYSVWSLSRTKLIYRIFIFNLLIQFDDTRDYDFFDFPGILSPLYINMRKKEKKIFQVQNRSDGNLIPVTYTGILFFKTKFVYQRKWKKTF